MNFQKVELELEHVLLEFQLELELNELSISKLKFDRVKK